jgi:hypothetical protein
VTDQFAAGVDRLAASLDATAPAYAAGDTPPATPPITVACYVPAAERDRLADELNQARAELAAAQELITAAKTWRWSGDTADGHRRAEQALMAAIDALPPSADAAEVPDRGTFARELAATLTDEVTPDAVQEFLERKGVEYDHTDVEEIEYLVERLQAEQAEG